MSTNSPEALARRRRLVWWLTSTALLLAVLLGVTAYYVVSTVQSFAPMRHTACLPADFPVYPSATVLEVDETFPVPQNGGLALCRVRMNSRDAYDSVSGFYRIQLNIGDWSYANFSDDTGFTNVMFHRRSHPATKGLLSIQKTGNSTPFDVQLNG